MRLIILVINFRRAGKKSSKSTILHVKQPQIPVCTNREAGSPPAADSAGWGGPAVCWGAPARAVLMGAVVTRLLQGSLSKGSEERAMLNQYKCQ